VVIHFGKNQGMKLGEASGDTLKWYAETWGPKPYNGKMNPKDLRLQAAAKEGYSEMKAEAAHQ
jgi:hypothetical protein